MKEQQYESSSFKYDNEFFIDSNSSSFSDKVLCDRIIWFIVDKPLNKLFSMCVSGHKYMHIVLEYKIWWYYLVKLG